METRNGIKRRWRPRWIETYLSYGLSNKDPREKRRAYISNLIGLWGGANALGFAIMHTALGLDEFWPMALNNILMAFSLFCVPLVVAKGPLFSACYLNFIFIPIVVSFCALGGTGTGVHLNLTIVPIGFLLVAGTDHKPLLVLVTASAILGMIASEVYFDQPLISAYDTPQFQEGNFAILSTIVMTVIVFSVYIAFQRGEDAEDALAAEHARSEALLYNLLPEDIAARLKIEPDKTIADSLPQVAILFADIVNFTPRSAAMQPEEIVDFLNRVFTAFDAIAKKHGLEKIKTIGDAYMVAAGMPHPVGDPVHRVAAMALDVLDTTRMLSDAMGEPVEVRVGLHCGPAVAGVIGDQKLFYDVWGDTVNTASRMESHGDPGRIQVTQAVKEELEDAYCFAPRGPVAVKGMGTVETWWLTRARPVRPPD